MKKIAKLKVRGTGFQNMYTIKNEDASKGNSTIAFKLSILFACILQCPHSILSPLKKTLLVSNTQSHFFSLVSNTQYTLSSTELSSHTLSDLIRKRVYTLKIHLPTNNL